MKYSLYFLYLPVEKLRKNTIRLMFLQLSAEVDVSMAIILMGMLFKMSISPVLNETIAFLRYFVCFKSQFWTFFFLRFWKQKSKMAGQDGRHSDNATAFIYGPVKIKSPVYNSSFITMNQKLSLMSC